MSESDKKRWGTEDFSSRLGYIVRKLGGATSLARRAGVSARVIGKWKSGASEPTLSRLVALAAAAGVSIEWLATGRGAVDDQILDEAGFYGGEALDPELVALAAGELHEFAREEGIELSAQGVRICVKAAARIIAKEPGTPVRDTIRDLL